MFGLADISYSLSTISFRSKASIKSYFLINLLVKLSSNDETQGRERSEGQEETEMS